jgi:hypothetical protein
MGSAPFRRAALAQLRRRGPKPLDDVSCMGLRPTRRLPSSDVARIAPATVTPEGGSDALRRDRSPGDFGLRKPCAEEPATQAGPDA